MGIQVAILGAVEDFSELLNVARKKGALAVPEFIPADETPELQDPEALFLANPGEKLYLLSGDLATAEIFTIEGSNRPGTERVNDRTSPVVEVNPARMDGRAMRAGRLYLGTDPSDSLFRSAKRLYDAIRRTTESWSRAQPGNVRVGPRAAEQAMQHGLILESIIGERLTLTKTEKP